MSLVVDHTVWKGLRGSSGTKTCHGYDYDMMISGVQKYLRAGDSSGMQYCALEILCLEQPAATSNLLHRLQVMAGEELLFADVGAFSDVYELLGHVERDRGNALAMLDVCELLAKGRLCRLPSDIRCHFGTLGASGLRHLMDSTPVPANFRRTVYQSDLDWGNDHPTEVMDLVDMFAYQLYDRKSYDCFYPLFEVLRLSAEGAVGSRPVVVKTYLRSAHVLKRAQSVYLLWALLMSKAGRHRVVMEQQLEWFVACLARQPKPKPGVRNGRPPRDYFVFLINAVLLTLHRTAVAPLPKRDPLELGSEASELAEHLNAHRLKPRMELLPTVIDMHTHAGRKAGKTAADFATQGALLAREDRQFFVTAWREQYVEYKVKQASVTERKDGAAPKRARSSKAEAQGEKKKKKKRESPDSDDPDAPVRPVDRIDVWAEVKALDEIPSLSWDTVVGANPVFCNGGRVCGQKPVCLRVTYEGKACVIKEVMSVNNTQGGRAYLAMDGLKQLVGGMPRSYPRYMRLDKAVRRNSVKNPSFVDNWRLESHPTLYIVLDLLPGVPLADVPHWSSSLEVRSAYLLVVLVRSVLCCSDTSARNAMYSDGDCGGMVSSIDESYILSPRQAEKGKMLGRTTAALRKLWLADYEAGRLDEVFNRVSVLTVDSVVRVLNESGFYGEANRSFIEIQLDTIRWAAATAFRA
jgi:hypothetical protein